jgi:conjugal transfer pilus assembly protein TraE
LEKLRESAMNYLNNSKEYGLKKSVNLWVVISASLMLSNVILALLCWYAIAHQKIEVTPFFGNQGYMKSDTGVDVHYLNQMSENFILTRLNVTASNIKANHARLLNYIDSKYYPVLTAALLHEQKQVIDQKISSYFDIESINSSPSELKSTLKGHLRRFVGMRELPPKSATYELKYAYHLGRLSIISFEKTVEHQDD